MGTEPGQDRDSRGLSGHRRALCVAEAPSSGHNVRPDLSGSRGTAVNPRLCPSLGEGKRSVPKASTEHLLGAGR